MDAKNDFLNRPAYTLTAGELIESTVDELEKRLLFRDSEKIQIKEKRVVRGINGLAKELGCSPVTAQKLKNSGKIPYSQYARVVMFDVDAVLAAISNKKK